MIGVWQCDQLGVVACDDCGRCVLAGNLDWHRCIGGSVYEPRLHSCGEEQDWRGRNVERNAGHEFLHYSVAEAHFRGKAEIGYACQRHDSRYGRAVPLTGYPEGQVASRRKTEQDYSIKIQGVDGRQRPQILEGLECILRGAGPPASALADAPVLYVPGCDAVAYKVEACWSHVLEVELGAPEAAVNCDDYRMRARCFGQQEISELARIITVGNSHGLAMRSTTP